MRPLVVFSGQGVARADGFNLTRRAKALSELRPLLARLERADRQNLDALIQAAVVAGSPPIDWVRGLRELCLKERRSTHRKLAHRDTLAAIAAASAGRVVVHGTANVDGLTTTFLARDLGARWAPYGGVASLDDVADDMASVCGAGAGLLHFPVHGEICLYLNEEDGTRMRTAYHHPSADADGTPWISSLVVGPGRGLDRVEKSLPSSRLAWELIVGLLRGGDIVAGGRSLGEFDPADLLVLGYGASDRGSRPLHPFERMVSRLSQTRDPGASLWTSLVYGPTTPRHVHEWFDRNGFDVVSYGDGELASRVSALLEGETCMVATQ